MDPARIESLNIFYYEKNRLQSFANWPTYSPMSPGELARSGFYYLGQDDRVQCAFCQAILGQWNEGDKPSEEHKKYYPNCPYILKPHDVGNVPFVYRETSVSSNPISRTNYSPESNVRAPVQETSSSPQSLSERPLHLQYNTFDQRLKTYQHYPQNTAQTPFQLAEAGFFYTGAEDNVKCFFCDGGLRSWDPIDNPWTEHARWFPQCGFLKLARGEEFIETVQNTFKDKHEGEGQSISGQAMTIQQNSDETALKYPVQVTTDEDRTLLKFGITNTAKKNTKQSNLPSWLRNDDNTRLKTSTSSFEQMEVTSGESHVKTTASATATRDNESKAKHSESPKDVNEGATGDKDLKKTIESLQEERMCKICMDSPIEVVFLECGHLVCCEGCSKQVRKCPMCRKPIIKAVRTYMS